MALNYLQGMAGRLGQGMGIDPRRRFAQQLLAQGASGSAKNVGEGLSQLSKSLLGMMLMKHSMGQETDAMKWLTAQRPDRTRQPTEEEAYGASPELEMLLQQSRPTAELTGRIPDIRPEYGPGLTGPEGREGFAGSELGRGQIDMSMTPTPRPDDWLMEKGVPPQFSKTEVDMAGEPVVTREEIDIPKTIEELNFLNMMQERSPGQTEFPYEGKTVTATPEDFAKLPGLIDEGSEKFIDQMERAREATTRFRPRDYAEELASGMEAYRTDPTKQISDPYTRMEWLRESARGMEGNPFVRRMLQNLMFADMGREEEEKLYQRGVGERKTAAELKHEQGLTAAELEYRRSQEPMTEKQLAQKMQLKQAGVRPLRPNTVNTAEGVYILKDDGTLGRRLGAPHSQFGYPGQGAADTLTTKRTQPKKQSGIPIHESRPWDRLPIRNQGAMQQEVHKTSRGMLEKNRQFLSKQRTMRDSLQRFKYLNAQQTKQAKESMFETPTGSLEDRMTEFSFDEEKREMVKIQNLLTPQMRQGLPGAASDRDVAMFRGATVGIDATQEINDNIIAGALARIDNAEDRQSFMEEYFQLNQHLDGAETYWKEYLEANPIFDHSPELVGSYTLNKNRQGYREFFGGSDAKLTGGALNEVEKNRLEELRRKKRG